ncbi:purine nucleoside transporter PunC [Orbaceae bacterium ESL0727]|nr:purine nucleoside transporter PunC [Orbaceae bacterium ESL0727]
MFNSKGFLVYLIFLSMLGFLATDMYLPAFDAMQSDLHHANRENVTMSMSVFLAGFAIAQLLWGQLSDAFGRSKILVWGLALSAISCLEIVFVHNIYYLLGLRFIQAVGICAAAVSWQALIVDRYESQRVNKVLATILPLMSLSPALAPLVGSLILKYASWREIFLTIFAITFALLVATFYYCRGKQTKTVAQQQENIGFKTLLSSRYYCGNVLIYSACSACFFSWLTGSPFILHDLGLSTSDIGLSYIPQTIVFLVGGYGCRFLLNYFTSKQILPFLLVIYSLSNLGVFLVAISGSATFVTIMIFFCGMAMMNGAIYPLVVGNALKPFPTASGKAAALQNTLQLALCFVASQIVSMLIQYSLIATSVVMLSTIVLVAIGHIMATRANPA